MALPTRKVRLEESTILPSHDEHQRLFPLTPHPSKRRRLNEDDNSVSAASRHTISSVKDIAEMPEDDDVYEAGLVSEIESPPAAASTSANEERDGDSLQEEPDWDKLAQNEPATTDIPIFLNARARKEAADQRFAAALDECHSYLHQCIDDLLQTAADLHNAQRDRLDAMEADIQNHFQWNDDARTKMERSLEESATLAQGLFAQLLMRVSQPLAQVTKQGLPGEGKPADSHDSTGVA